MSEVLVLNPSGKKVKAKHIKKLAKKLKKAVPVKIKIKKGDDMKKGKHLRALSTIHKGSRARGHMFLGNPGGLLGLSMINPKHRNPVAALADNIVHPVNMDGLVTLGTAGLGALGTAAIPTSKLVEYIPGIGKVKMINLLLSNGINMTLLASIAKMAFKRNPEVAHNVLAGGLTVTAVQLFKLLATAAPNVTMLQTVSDKVTMSGLGTNAALRKAVQERVMKELGQPASAPIYATTVGQPKSDNAYMTMGGNLMDTTLND